MGARVLIRGLVVVLLLCVSSFCLAVGSALVVHDGTAGIEADVLASISGKLFTFGYIVTPSVGVPGGSLAIYREIWDIRFNNTTPLTPSDITAYITYMSGGGSLFVIGENTGFPTRNNSIVSLVSAAGGGSITVTNPNSQVQAVQPPFTGPTPLTTITFLAAAGAPSPGTGGNITQDGSNIAAGLVFSPGTLANAPAGALLIVFDVNFLQTGADANSQALANNMVAYLAAPISLGVAVPTLSTWAMLILGLALAAVALRFLAGGVRAG
jgi:hypothetical protein